MSVHEHSGSILSHSSSVQW